MEVNDSPGGCSQVKMIPLNIGQPGFVTHLKHNIKQLFAVGQVIYKENTERLPEIHRAADTFYISGWDGEACRRVLTRFHCLVD